MNESSQHTPDETLEESPKDNPQKTPENSEKNPGPKKQGGFERMMEGRRGIDELSRFIVVIGAIITIIAMITNIGALSIVATLVLLVPLLRCLSTNLDQRQRENDAFCRLTKGPRQQLVLLIRNIQYRKTKRFFICPSCGKFMSIPVGQGKIKISCPYCDTEMIRKS